MWTLQLEDIGQVLTKIWAFTENDPDPRGNGDFVETQTLVIPTLLGEVKVDSFQVHPDFQCVEGCRSSDSLALVALYHATDGPNWTRTWDLDEPMNTWYGITLNEEGCVARLRLNSNGLTGVIPANWDSLRT